MDKIACQFDVTSDCIIRSRRHKIPSANKDEKLVIASLSRIKPFDLARPQNGFIPKIGVKSIKNH